MDILARIAREVEQGNAEAVESLTTQALSENIAAEEILNQGLVAGMDAVGLRYKNNEIFIPEVLVAAKAMKAGMAHIKPILAQSQMQAKGTVVLGTVRGDLHDIGKNIVAMLLEGAGYEIVDLGADVSNEKFVESVKTNQADVVGMSTLLTTTMSAMKEIVRELEAESLRSRVKIIIGGAPVTQAFADSIQADGYAPDAASAVGLVDGLLKR